MNSGDKEIRKHALRRYFIARIKLMELMIYHMLLLDLTDGSYVPTKAPDYPAEYRAELLRVPCICWWATLIDKTSGLNIMELWRILYPHHKHRINSVEKSIEPQWDIIRQFRNQAGFHGDKAKEFFDATIAYQTNIKKIVKSLQEFMDLAMLLMSEEEKMLSDFEDQIDHVLLNVELRHPDYKIANRKSFKKLYCLPSEENFKRFF